MIYVLNVCHQTSTSVLRIRVGMLARAQTKQPDMNACVYPVSLEQTANKVCYMFLNDISL